MTSNVALAAAAFGRRNGIVALVLGAAAIGAAGAANFAAGFVLVAVLGFVIGAGMTITTVGTMSEGERRLRQRYHELVDGLDAIVWEADPNTFVFSYVSHGAEQTLGYPIDDWTRPGFWVDHLHPEDREEAADLCRRETKAARDHEAEYRMIAADGRTVWVHDLVRVETDGLGAPVLLRGVMVDITDRKEAEAIVHTYARIVEDIPVALFVARLEGADGALRIAASNPRAGELLGVDVQHLVGRDVEDALPGIGQDLLDRLVLVARGAEPFDVDRLGGVTNDEDQVFSLHAFSLEGNAVGVSLDDVTGPAMAAAAMRHRALHDDLTGLPNRTLLRDRLLQSLFEARRSGESVALLLLDLDQFKEVNDALGHLCGDQLLVKMAHRLQDVLRECDTIARLGGDEFALLLTTDASTKGAIAVAEKVAKALADPFDIDGMALHTSASIGIAVYPDHADSADGLTQHADVAMYAAKRSGTTYAVYMPAEDRSSVTRLTLLGELHRALEHEELVLHYQPVIDAVTGGTVATEALVRWQHPQLGLLPPSSFVELSEVSGLVQQLTRWVIERAVRTATSWRADGYDIGVSANLSVRNLYDAQLVPWICSLLEETELPPHLLTLELTESELMEDPALAIQVLGRLREFGVLTCIDDFGTGYSSLSYLRRLPVSAIKIDQSFVSGILDDQSDATIVRTIIQLAHDLGLDVLAEGVEDGPTFEMLRALGCDRVQGYFTGAPMTSAALLTHVDHDVRAAQVHQ
jgi:diguanylate cyclase (GGDEF)-like protein/PAS domain S-box-containing protein